MPRRSAHCAPVAQLDRALPSEGRGRRFESCRVRQSLQSFMCALGRTQGLKGAVRARALTQMLGSREAYAKCFTKSAQSPATDRRDRLSRYIYWRDACGPIVHGRSTFLSILFVRRGAIVGWEQRSCVEPQSRAVRSASDDAWASEASILHLGRREYPKRHNKRAECAKRE